MIRGTQYIEEKRNGELPDKRAGGTGKFGITNARSDDVTRLEFGGRWYR